MTDHPTYSTSYHPEKIRRETTRRFIWLGLLSVMIVLLAFWLGLLLFPLAANLPATTGTGASAKTLDWNLLGGLTGLVTTALILGGLGFAFFEYIETAAQRKIEFAQTSFGIYEKVFDRLMNPEAQAARRWIILNVPSPEDFGNDQATWMEFVRKKLNEIPDGWDGQRPPGVENLKAILDCLDFIGFVGEHYWSMENELVFWMSPPVSKVWERVGRYVEEEARLRNEPDYYESARKFGQYCLDWRQAHFPKSRMIKDAI